MPFSWVMDSHTRGTLPHSASARFSAPPDSRHRGRPAASAAISMSQGPRPAKPVPSALATASLAANSPAAISPRRGPAASRMRPASAGV